MRQSNTYIIVFSAVLTIILGGLISLASVGLKPMQDLQVALDTQKKILGAVMDLQPSDDVPAIYNERVESLVVNAEGEEVNEVDGEPIVAEKVNIASQFDKDPENRLYPVYKYKGDNGEVSSYVLPIYGTGLWDDIWGYVALESDLETIRGVVFDHAGETPGLGARITTVEVQERFAGKKIYSDVGELVAVRMMKGETGDPSIYNDNQVDGMSGATITANGVNNMLLNYLNYYQPYLKKVAGGAQASKAETHAQKSDV